MIFIRIAADDEAQVECECDHRRCAHNNKIELYCERTATHVVEAYGYTLRLCFYCWKFWDTNGSK